MPNFTRNAIKASFLKLLSQRPLNQITVKDIVEDCGVNRNSFYYHFEDLPALLEEIVGEQAAVMIQRHPTVASAEEGCDAIVEFVAQNKRAVYHIYNSLSRDIFERHLMKLCQHVVSAYVEALPAPLRPLRDGHRLAQRGDALGHRRLFPAGQPPAPGLAGEAVRQRPPLCLNLGHMRPRARFLGTGLPFAHVQGGRFALYCGM